jgi:hypothetical protein
MAKKSKPASSAAKPKSGMSAEDHRKIANTLQAKARIHHAQADLHDAQHPPKGKKTYPGCY